MYRKIAPSTFEIPKEKGMLVPGLIIASEILLKEQEISEAIKQVQNVAHLPGIVGYSIAMPDIHWGYGFPIGGVAATDSETGVISPGGVGYDINCGVRLAIIPVPFSSLSEKTKKELITAIYALVPSGVGKGHKNKSPLTEKEYNKLLQEGSKWSVDQGYGLQEDLARTESNGVITGADPSLISHTAKERGKDQLGTIGSGNHFVEIGEVQTLFSPAIAQAWQVEQGQTYVLIHSGSRGLGHQVCQDALDLFVSRGFDKGLPDRQLVAAPLNSTEGKNYFSAMACAANFAFNNRQRILHEVRDAVHQVLRIPQEQVRLIYDVCHNIAKMEEHIIQGKKRLLCVHRKGATRAFGPGNKELTQEYQASGQPVLVPGDMGRASHLMVGLGNPLTFCSSCHGAGRARSRVKSLKSWEGRDTVEYMRKQGVTVKASSSRTIAEEMPDAYKNVDDVVDAVEEAGLAKKVARLKPYLVLKG